MTSEYVPTTERVRSDYGENAEGTSEKRLAAFDLWLAEHDAKLIEKLAEGINGRSGGQQELWLREQAQARREQA